MIRDFLLKLKDQGWTQEAIAEKVGVRQSQISKWLAGDDIKVSTLLKIAKAFNVTTDEVLSLAPPPEDPPKKKTNGYNSYNLTNI